jgi:hypothetical protein
MLVLPALDRRFVWSSMSVYLALAGQVLVLIGFLIVFLVHKENTFASATIELAPEQKVISTGLYPTHTSSHCRATWNTKKSALSPDTASLVNRGCDRLIGYFPAVLVAARRRDAARAPSRRAR